MVVLNENIIKIIEEELSKSEVTSLINSKLDSNLTSKEFEKKIKSIVADVLSEFFKLLWQRESLWKNSVKR